MKIQDLDTNITDRSAKEFCEEVVAELSKFLQNFDTHSMNSGVLILEGKKQMLSDIIEYLKSVKPS